LRFQQPHRWNAESARKKRRNTWAGAAGGSHLPQRLLRKRFENVGEETALVRLRRVGIATQRHFAVSRREHFFEFAVRLQRGAEAGKDRVRAANAVLE
jgi:hypothetical protein